MWVAEQRKSRNFKQLPNTKEDSTLVNHQVYDEKTISFSNRDRKFLKSVEIEK